MENPEKVITQAAPPAEPPYQEESPTEGNGGGTAMKIVLILVVVLAMGMLSYAAYVHTKASKKHLANERLVADKIARGELNINTRNN